MAWFRELQDFRLVFGADFAAVVPEMLALIAFAVIFGIIAIWRFRTSAV